MNFNIKNSIPKLNYVLITQGVSRIVHPILTSHHNIVGIVESAAKNNRKNPFVFSIFKNVYSLVKRRQISLKALARFKGIPYYLMDSGSDSHLESWIKKLNPDLIVVFSMSQLLHENIFSIPRYGTINLHPSELPKYRGPFPDFWIYYNMDLHPGVTVHYIDQGEDTGDIIFQEQYDLPLGIKSPEMLDIAIGEIGIRLLLRAMNSIASSNAPRIPQPKESPTKRSRRIKASEHKEFIKWDEWSIERIWHFLRGTELWLNAIDQPIGFYKGQRWSVLDYEITDMKAYIPSKIYKEKGAYFVACRDGKIYIKSKFSLKSLILFIFKARES